MITYDRAKAIAISNTIPDGKVYYSGDAGEFYIFIIVPKDFPMDIPNPMFGSTFTAVDKVDGRLWECPITNSRLKNIRKVEGSEK